MNALTEPARVIKDDIERYLEISVSYTHVLCALAPLLGYRTKEQLTEVNEFFAAMPDVKPCIVLQPHTAARNFEKFLNIASNDPRANAVLTIVKHGLEHLAPGSVFDNDNAFVSWYEKTHLTCVLQSMPEVQKAQAFCTQPCTVYVNDSAGHDQRPPLLENRKNDYWYQDSVGQLCPRDLQGRPIQSGDYIGLLVTTAFRRLGGGTLVELQQSAPVSVTAWATRYDASMGGIALSGAFRTETQA